MIELAQLPIQIQQLIEAKTPVEIVNNGQLVAILNPNLQVQQKSLFDIFASADPNLADIELDLPPRTFSHRPIPFENE
nr:hypothetical protein [uncultured Moraxella sp.]